MAGVMLAGSAFTTHLRLKELALMRALFSTLLIFAVACGAKEGTPSPGATSSLAIGKHIAGLAEEGFSLN